MNKQDIIKSLETRNDRSAWNKGVTTYAIDMVDAIEDESVLGSPQLLKKELLNGADDWNQYSYGGCALIYDYDIAEMLCTPSELKRTGGGRLQPNSRETWLDVQARALFQACERIKRIVRAQSRKAA